ncbi:MAG: TadE/TadG family type IV pilus assembly protein [Geminicoccaceae bacterium]
MTLWIVRLSGRSRHFRNDSNGAILIELAILLPVLFIILMGLMEFRSAFLMQKRVSVAATVLSVLASANDEITKEDLAEMQAIAAAILHPFPSPSLKVKVTSVTYVDGGLVVNWAAHDESGGTLPEDADELLAGLLVELETAYITEVLVDYQPPIASFLDPVMTFESVDVSYKRGGGAKAREPEPNENSSEDSPLEPSTTGRTSWFR